VDWIHMGQDRDRWWALVNRIPSQFGFHKMHVHCPLRKELLAWLGTLLHIVS
jgi:hypothetical protein